MQDGHQPQAFGLPPLLGRCPISLFSLLLSLYADSLLLGTFSFTSFSPVYSVAPELLCFHSSHVLPSGLWPPNAPQQVLRMAPARFLSCALSKHTSMVRHDSRRSWSLLHLHHMPLERSTSSVLYLALPSQSCPAFWLDCFLDDSRCSNRQSRPSSRFGGLSEQHIMLWAGSLWAPIGQAGCLFPAAARAPRLPLTEVCRHHRAAYQWVVPEGRCS